MEFALSTEGRAVMSACARAGVVFRPGGGRLNPELTRGDPPAGLLDQVRQHREELLAFFGALFGWMDEPSELIAGDNSAGVAGEG